MGIFLHSMIKGKEPDPYKEVEIFPYISSQLPQSVTVKTSELKVSGAEICCLILYLFLFLYSCLTFYRTWKKNYRMPDGVFYFEEEMIETQETRTAEPRLETKISL